MSLLLKTLQTFRPETLLTKDLPKKQKAQVFYCEYCKTFNTTYFEKHLQTTAF